MYPRWVRGDFEISTDPARVDLNSVHAFLTQSYWASGIPIATVERSLQNSLCFGLYKGNRQAGFARVITDCATFAYLGDVFILPEYRGHGLTKWMMECILAHPDLQGLRRWSLLTRDAHSLYRQFGFTELKSPERWMERHDPDIYARTRQNSDQQK